jgi:hypothetical protein
MKYMQAALIGSTLILAHMASADGLTERGLDDPEVLAPASTWDGPYIGLSYSRVSRSSETVECFKLGDPKDCDDPIFIYYPEYKVEVRTATETSDDVVGAIAGYRFDLGRLVPGVELGIYEDAVLPGVNLGVDLGNLLPYAHYDRDGAALGIEARLSPRITAGLRAGEDRAALTVGWAW